MSESKPGPVAKVPNTLPEVELYLLPDDVPEPQYIARRNKVRCPWCGTDCKTRRKYIEHFKRRHNV